MYYMPISLFWKMKEAYVITFMSVYVSPTSNFSEAYEITFLTVCLCPLLPNFFFSIVVHVVS
jgi:hypothetical protein